MCLCGPCISYKLTQMVVIFHMRLFRGLKFETPVLNGNLYLILLDEKFLPCIFETTSKM